jgi:hypothetical protein
MRWFPALISPLYFLAYLLLFTTSNHHEGPWHQFTNLVPKTSQKTGMNFQKLMTDCIGYEELIVLSFEN